MADLLPTLLTLVLLCLSPCVAATAQEKPELVTRLERVFAQKEPRWKLDRKHVQTSPPVLHLKSAQGDALIHVFIADSEGSAKDLFVGNTVAFGNTMGARGRRSKLPEFADENLMFTGFVVGGVTSIHFRRGTIYIQITAPSQTTAKRFARHVMEQIVTLDEE